eukprot:14244396-Heterocapsa_arctica.AAC.1
MTDHCNPWVKLLMEDIELLGEFDIYAHIPDFLGGNPAKLLSDEYLRNEFLKVDPTIFKAKTRTVAIPPPGYTGPVVLGPFEEPVEEPTLACPWAGCAYTAVGK